MTSNLLPLPDLLPIFASLTPPSELDGLGVQFVAHPIPGFTQHRLAKDVRGTPAILLATGGGQTASRLAPITLEHLRVQHDVECRVAQPGGGAYGGRFTIVSCPETDPAMHAYFLRVAGAVILTVGSAPSQQDVTRVIGALAELFHALVEAPRTSVQGLWAELFVIVRARDPISLVRAWHTTLEDRFDFSAGPQRIEVKSVAGKQRRHHFSLEQIHPPDGVTVLIASVRTETSGGGTSLQELVGMVRASVVAEPTLLLHVDRIIGLALGRSWRHAMEQQFDIQLAASSLAFFRAVDVPSVSPDIPAGVSGVHFTADLTEVTPMPIAACRAAGGLFRAVTSR